MISRAKHGVFNYLCMIGKHAKLKFRLDYVRLSWGNERLEGLSLKQQEWELRLYKKSLNLANVLNAKANKKPLWRQERNFTFLFQHSRTWKQRKHQQQQQRRPTRNEMESFEFIINVHSFIYLLSRDGWSQQKKERKTEETKLIIMQMKWNLKSISTIL